MFINIIIVIHIIIIIINKVLEWHRQQLVLEKGKSKGKGKDKSKDYIMQHGEDAREFEIEGKKGDIVKGKATDSDLGKGKCKGKGSFVEGRPPPGNQWTASDDEWFEGEWTSSDDECYEMYKDLGRYIKNSEKPAFDLLKKKKARIDKDKKDKSKAMVDDPFKDKKEQLEKMTKDDLFKLMNQGIRSVPKRTLKNELVEHIISELGIRTLR